jgi:AAA domain-containing protein
MAWKRRAKQPKDPDYRRVLDKIVPVDELEPEVKVILYGRSSTGKTTLAATFPKPILFIDVSEKGTDSIRRETGIDVLRVEEWQDIEDAYWMLKSSKHKYKSIVIDTVSQTQDLAIKTVMADANQEVDSGAVGNWGTMTKRQWGQVSTKIKTTMLNFRDLDMNVVFIAHDRVFNAEDEDDDAGITPEVGPRLMPSVATTLNGAVSVIGNTFIREVIKEIKIGKKTKEKRIVQYCLRIGPHAIYTTKIRKPRDIELPAIVIDPSYEQIVALTTGE